MKRFLKDFFCICLLFVALCCVLSLAWTQHLWGDVDVEQIIINAGANLSEVSNQALAGYYIAIAVSLLAAILTAAFVQKNRYLIITALVLFSLVIYKIEFVPYLFNKYTYSDLYEKEYVAPQDINYTFAEPKRNLIVIYLESMEADYADPALAGANLIPNLSKHMQQDLSFDGFHQIRHQDYTIAAMIESMCAIAYHTSEILSSLTDYYTFLDGAICYPQILKQHGYKTYFMKGANINFTRTKLFMSSHGFDSVQGKKELEEEHHLALKENLGSFFGYRDSALFEMAKRKLTKISSQDEPFYLAMITLDTHTPDMYLDKKCKGASNDIQNVAPCSDKLVQEFLTWIQAQPFYKNTTVVVLSDHPKTSKNNLYPHHQNRKIVNFILNPAVARPQNKHHAFTTLDIAPTVLNAVGIDFKDGKFGLGRSLFESTPTLFEKMGTKLDTELAKASHTYETFEKSGQRPRPAYLKYEPLGKTIASTSQIEPYAMYFNTLFGSVYLSEMSFLLPITAPKDLTMTIRFRTMLNKQNKRHIKIIANGTVVDDWNFSPQDKQPIVKKINIPHTVLTDNRLLVEFSADDPFRETLSIGVISFDIVDSNGQN